MIFTTFVLPMSWLMSLTCLSLSLYIFFGFFLDQLSLVYQVKFSPNGTVVDLRMDLSSGFAYGRYIYPINSTNVTRCQEVYPTDNEYLLTNLDNGMYPVFLDYSQCLTNTQNPYINTTALWSMFSLILFLIGSVLIFLSFFFSCKMVIADRESPNVTTDSNASSDTDISIDLQNTVNISFDSPDDSLDIHLDESSQH